MTNLDEVLRIKKAHPTWSAAQIAALAGTTKDTVQKIIKRGMEAPAFDVEIPPVLMLEGDRVVTADVHVPTTSKVMAEKVLLAGKKRNIRRLSLVGDLFCQDMFSRYAQLINSHSFKSEVNAAKELFGYWMGWYEEVEFCRGNHDDRLISWTNGAVAMQELADMVKPESGKITTSMRNYMKLHSGDEDWTLVHQRKYSKKPLSVACDFAAKHRTNVVCCHQHHCAVGVYEGFTVVDCGCLADAEKTAYMQLDLTTFPDWEPGFVVIQDGHADLYSERGQFGIKE